MYLFRIVYQTRSLRHSILSSPPKRKGRLINRPLQSMKTGGNNPDKRQIWSLSYKTNFNSTPFFKSSSEWRTGELKPLGCRICFSLIALSGYLTQWQMTKTPPVTDRLSLCLSQSLLCGVFFFFYLHIIIHCQVSAGAPAEQYKSISLIIQNVANRDRYMSSKPFWKRSDVCWLWSFLTLYWNVCKKETLRTQNWNKTDMLKRF